MTNLKITLFNFIFGLAVGCVFFFYYYLARLFKNSRKKNEQSNTDK